MMDARVFTIVKLPVMFETPLGEVRAWVANSTPPYDAASGTRSCCGGWAALLWENEDAFRRLHAAVTGTEGAPIHQAAAELRLAIEAGLIAFREIRPVRADPPSALPVTELAALVPVGQEEAERAAAFIGVVVEDQEGTPLPSRRVAVLQHDEHVRSAATNLVGFADVDGLLPGVCRLIFMDLDTRDFAPQTALPGVRPLASSGPVRATVPASNAQAVDDDVQAA